MKGLLTLKELETSKIIELIEYSIKLKNGHKVSYPNKKVVTLFYEKCQHLFVDMSIGFSYICSSLTKKRRKTWTK